MVTEKDIINMGRKIKRSNNPKTLAKYQIQIDAWIAELEEAQARTQADILALEEKIKMEEEARAAQKATQIQDPATGKFAPVPVQKSETGETSKEQAKKIAEKAGVSPASAPESPPGESKKSLGLPGIPTLKESKKVAVKIAEKVGVSPRKCYSYHEFERLHLRRSS